METGLSSGEEVRFEECSERSVMTYKLLLILCVVVIRLGLANYDNGVNMSNGHQSSRVKAEPAKACGGEVDVSHALQRLSSGKQADIDQARRVLLDGSRTQRCRNEIVGALIKAMDQPNLDFELHGPNYFLWLEGSRLISDLKAAEALDLLISHLDLNDGFFSASMVHQPAILGVIGIGPVAIPKLNIALRTNANRDIRLAATFCLTSIGGESAVNAIRLALRTESDRCVAHFMRLSLTILDTRSTSSKPSDRMGDMNAQREWMLAFRCA